jgi:ribosomal protein L29
MKFKELKKMEKKELKKMEKELKMELIKSRINSIKKGNSKTKEIKKRIAQILTLNKSEEMLNNK